VTAAGTSVVAPAARRVNVVPLTAWTFSLNVAVTAVLA
jgi:hypothetical protein